MNGYWSKILRIDLSRSIVNESSIEETFYKRFIGGAGLGAKIIYDETRPSTDAFSPENKIIFSVGPFQGTRLPGSAKWCVVSKSPLTGTYANSHCGAGWGVKFKGAGYDALVIQGKAEKPVYIWIHDGEVEIRDARSFWGSDSYEAVDALKNDVGEQRASVATIGPAGEKLVRIACVIVDKHSFAGRCGLGAVMGSKNLKGVVVYGTKRTPIFDLDKVEELTKELTRKIKEFAKDFTMHGTPGSVSIYHDFGDMPIRYWQGDIWSEGVKKLGAPLYTKILKVKPHPCIYCPIGCHRYGRVDEPTKYAFEGSAPEYETLAMLGSLCLVDDLKAVAKAGDVCNRLGIDTISAGAAVGFAMECFERGWLTVKETNGLKLEWGDGDSLIELVKQIGLRKGFGQIFSDGTLEAARKIGRNASDIVVHVRGLDFPAHDPRACFSLAVNYATSTRGACHERGMPEDIECGVFNIPELDIQNTGFFKPEGKAKLAIQLQDFAALLNSLVICNFMLDGGGMTLTETLNCFNAITGWEWSIKEFMKAGERIFNLQRLINIGDGVGGSYDKLPKRMFEPAKEGFRRGQIPPFDFMLKEYYRLRGWNSSGEPTKKKLIELKIN